MDRFRAAPPPARLVAGLLLLAGGCGDAGPRHDGPPLGSPRERHAHHLRAAGLDQTALGREWIASGERVLSQAQPVPLPHRELLTLSAEQAGAVAFSLDLRRGERLWVSVDPLAEVGGRVFVDLLALPSDSGAAPHAVRSADSTSTRLTWLAHRDATYLLRVQPELLRGGRFIVTLRTSPSLAFPVADRDSRAVGSRFGAPRDGGRREHHGIDIFAPRGTPVVAAAEGVVRSVDTTRLGGRVVWLWSREHGASLYYAHLDSQTVVPGMRVRPGDTLGTVGTTGNARGTPPHLHFGIYRRGPVDPFPFVHTMRAAPPPIRRDPSLLGSWHRTLEATHLRAAPEGRRTGREVAPGSLVLALGVSGGSYRVRLPDGMEGYLPARATEPAAPPDGSVPPASGSLAGEHPPPAAKGDSAPSLPPHRPERRSGPAR